MRSIIQIAGVIDDAEAQMLLAAGVDWLGFPLRLPVHREDLSEAEAARIIAAIPPPHAATLITYLDAVQEILSLCRFLGVRQVQLHGPIAVAEVKALKQADPQLLLIKSLVVKQDNLEELLEQAKGFGGLIDAFITDTHDPLTGADGATGKTHDWRISRRLVEALDRPVILAGGIDRPKRWEGHLRRAPGRGGCAHRSGGCRRAQRCAKGCCLCTGGARGVCR